ncbi:hypothetical protein ACA086_05555 [Muriicola sp. E247]|uniref:hypothetical protein n=1 Tax=Muriicola sp. E247 TaxID=3242730 RepID=UPI003523E814
MSIAFSTGFVHAQVQQIAVSDLYGKWVNTGSFRNGKQVLNALKTDVNNPMKYYFTLNANGTFSYDVVSLDVSLKEAKRTGKWFLSPNRKRITLIDDQINPEERQIPGDFLNFENDGSLSSKPLIFPIMELTTEKMVLYDEYHKTRDVFIRE